MDEIDNLLARDVALPGVGHNQPPLAETLREEHAPALARAAYLLHGGNDKHGFDGFPAVIGDDNAADLAPAFAKQLNAHAKTLEEAHAAAKRPWLEAARTVDGIFLGLVRELRDAARTVNQRLLVWHQSQKAPAPILRSSYGPSASVRRTVAWKVLDATKIPRQFLKPDPVVIALHIKLGQGALPPEVPGLEFYVDTTMVSR